VAIIIARMATRAAPGRTAARLPDAPHDELGRPSKSQRKKDSAQLQELGRELSLMPPDRLVPLNLEEPLLDALTELRRTKTHEGRRRQLQYVGKLMRQADEAPLREAVAQFKLGSARDTWTLHEAERWREALLVDDEALTRWAHSHPHSDLQQLRSLLRAARSSAAAEPVNTASSHGATRHSRAYRELFQFLRQHLSAPV